MEMNPGVSLLAGVLHSQTRKDIQANTSPSFDFGVIQADYSLLTNKFPIPIPQTDYLVLRQLTLGPTGSPLTVSRTGEGSHRHENGDHVHSGGTHGGHTGGSGDHSHSGGDHYHDGDGTHIHTVLIPEKMRHIVPGDRVLVAWVEQDAVVLDIIISASQIGG